MSYALNHNSRCAVIGHGSWATALVKLLAGNEKTVFWYVRNEEIRESLLTESHNCRYLSDVELDMERIRLFNDLNDTVSRADLLFFVAPAAFLKDYLSDLQVTLKNKFIVSAIKGIIPDSYQSVTDYLKQNYGLVDEQLSFITGPTHAEEVAHGKLTYLTLVGADMESVKIVGEKLKASFVHFNYTSEMHFLECVSCLKNIYALMVGIAVGMGYGDNFIAVLVSNCMSEMCRFLDVTPANTLESISSSGFLGDLLVSCYSSHSRNRQLGVLIGQGHTVMAALNEMTMVAEGYYASKLITGIPAAKRQNMPIAEAVYMILHQNRPAHTVMKNLEACLC